MDEDASDDLKKEVKTGVFQIIKDARKNPSKYGIGSATKQPKEKIDQLFSEDSDVFTPEQLSKLRVAVEEKLEEL